MISSTSAAASVARTDRVARAVIYAALILFAVYFLLPLFVMLVNSVKPLDEIRGGNMLALPEQFTIAPWLSAWSTAQIGVVPSGLRPYFWNSTWLRSAIPVGVLRNRRPAQTAPPLTPRKATSGTVMTA